MGCWAATADGIRAVKLCTVYTAEGHLNKRTGGVAGCSTVLQVSCLTLIKVLCSLVGYILVVWVCNQFRVLEGIPYKHPTGTARYTPALEVSVLLCVAA